MSEASYMACMEKHGVHINNERIAKNLKELGNITSLNEGLNIAKGFIENFFVVRNPKKIFDLIEKERKLEVKK